MTLPPLVRRRAAPFLLASTAIAWAGPPTAPAAAQPATTHAETVTASRQFDDGRILLAASDAVIAGTQAHLGRAPDDERIGFWSNPTDAVSWTWKPTRWGAYDVCLVYATTSPPGGEIAATIGGSALKGRLDSTGSWRRSTTLSLGRVVIPSTSNLQIELRCTKPAGGAVMNIEALTLTPACEGTPPRQAPDGTILLHGRDATIRGTALRWEPAEKKQTLGFWTRATDAAEWTFTIDTPGTFDVEVLQGCGTGQGGSEMGVDIDPAQATHPTIAFTVEDTGGFQAFKPRTVGRVTLDAAGEHMLRVQPKKIVKTAACDIRQIRLVPVEK